MTLAQLRARRDEVLRVAAVFDARNVRVFGSVARDDADANSDVDLLVDLPSEYRGFAFFGVLDEMREALEAVLRCQVDVLSIRTATSQSEPIADCILREAIPL